jgi:hypothetical protein
MDKTVTTGSLGKNVECPTPLGAVPRECGAPNRAAVLRALLSRGWIGNRAVGTETATAYFQGSSPKAEDCSMRVHLDRKYLDGLDGNVVAFVVISLIIIIAFVY